MVIPPDYVDSPPGGPKVTRSITNPNAPAPGQPQIRTVWNEALGVYFVYELDPTSGEWISLGTANAPKPETGSGGGGSGYIPPDHFFDVSPVDEWSMGFEEQKFEADENYRRAQLDLDRAKQTGDLELARTAQAASNYWQGVSAQLEQQRQAITANAQQVDWQGRLLESETARKIAEQSGQTNQFGAETTRMGTAGDLAQRQNELIAKMASDPRDLFSLYFMQREVAPDWNALQNRTPGVGSALVPQNSLTAYQPTTTAPVTGQGTLAGSSVSAPSFITPQVQRDFGMPPGAAPGVAPSTGGSGAIRLPDGRLVDQGNRIVTPMARGGVTTAPAIVGDDPRGQDRSREEIATPVLTADGRPAIHVQPTNPAGLAAQGQARLRMLAGLPPVGASRATDVMPRYAVGTDNSDAYAQNGFGSQWMPSSGNQHLAGRTLPPNLQMLADYGVPIAPDLAAASTGGIIQNPNTGAALAGRGAGMAPSLQGLRAMDPNLRKTYESLVQGVGGIPFDSLVDFLSKLTGNLKTATRSRGVPV